MELIDKALMASVRDIRDRTGRLVVFVPRLDRGPVQDESKLCCDFDRQGMREVEGRDR